MRTKIMICGLVIIAMAGCAPTLSGQLKGPGGEVVTTPDARVNISSLSAAEGAILVVPVDGSGQFSTDEDLPAGEYLVEALVPGFGLASTKVQVGGDEPEVELTMTPLERPKTTAIKVNINGDAGRGGGGATLTPPNL
jgi:hypothetical protein